MCLARLQEISTPSFSPSATPRPLAVICRQRQARRQRKSFSQHASAPIHWQFGPPGFSVVLLPSWPFSFPIHELRRRSFQNVLSVRRFVAAFPWSLLRSRTQATRECQVSCASGFQTSLAVVQLLP